MRENKSESERANRTNEQREAPQQRATTTTPRDRRRSVVQRQPCRTDVRVQPSFSRDPFDFRFHFLVVENSIRHALAITSTALSAARRLRVVSLPPAADFERKINKYNFSFLTLLLTACAFFEPFFFSPFF